MTADVLEFAARKVAEGQKVALVTVTETNGSSPASPGQIMAVLSDGSASGTVGGGASEYRVVRQAAEAIQSGSVVFKFSFDHAENGMICGGGMSGFGNILGGGASLYIFGGGHISQSLARIAASTGFAVTVIEDRPEFASAFDCARYVVCKPEDYEARDPVPDSGYTVICTRGHSTDGVALRYCLKKRLKYLGMIGSEKKVRGLFEEMLAEGVERTELDRVYAPVGLDIASVSPAEIAVAILAEILLVKNHGQPKHKRLFD